MGLGPLNINMNLAETKTALPVITDGSLVPIKLLSVDGHLREDDPSKPETKWTFATTAPAPTTDGDSVAPGFKLISRIQLYAKETTENKTWFQQKIARFIDALCGTGDKDNKKGRPERPPFNDDTIAKMIGLECFAKVTISRDQNGVDRNEILLLNKEDLPKAV